MIQRHLNYSETGDRGEHAEDGGADQLIPMRLDTRSLPLNQGLEMARHLMGDEYSVAPLPGDPPKLSVSGDLWVLPSLSAAHDFDMNCRLWRRRSPRPSASIRYRVVKEGSLHGIIDNVGVALNPGDILVAANNVPWAIDLEDFTGRFISMSTASLGYDRMGGFGYEILRRGDPQTTMIETAIEAFFDGLQTADTAIGETLALMLRGTLERHLDELNEAGEDGADRSRDWQAAMLSFIEENLGDPDLRVDSLMEAFPTSRAVIYREFEALGGVSNYIRKRRLERALSALVFDQPDTPVGDIAEAVGFRSKSQFAAAFKKHFGVSASYARTAYGSGAKNYSATDSAALEGGVLMRELMYRSGHI